MGTSGAGAWLILQRSGNIGGGPLAWVAVGISIGILLVVLWEMYKFERDWRRSKDDADE